MGHLCLMNSLEPEPHVKRLFVARDVSTVISYPNGGSWMNISRSVAHLSVYMLDAVPQLEHT